MNPSVYLWPARCVQGGQMIEHHHNWVLCELTFARDADKTPILHLDFECPKCSSKHTETWLLQPLRPPITNTWIRDDIGLG